MKFKKLISALTLGTALSSIALGVVSCSSVEERPTTVEGFDETQNYDSKEKVNLKISECTLAVRSTFVIPIDKGPGDVKYTFTSSDGTVAKVVSDTGYVVAISEGDATIYIKGSDNTYGEFIVHVKAESIDTSEVGGNIDSSDSTGKITPIEINANCADEIVVSRNEELMIEFSFDIDIDKISEAHRYKFAYYFEVDRSSITNDENSDADEQLKGGTEALRWGGRLNRYLIINDGTRVLPAGKYTLTAAANTLSKTIKITVSDDIIVSGVDIIGNNGIENIIRIDGYKSQTITPIFSPWAANGSSYTLTPVDSSIVSVDHTDLGGSAVITGKKVGTTYVRLDVGKEGKAGHFRRYIPVTINEVGVETFGGFRIWPHLKTATQLRENPNNCTINGSNPKVQAMVVPSNATTIRNSSTCIAYNLRAPGHFGYLSDESNKKKSSAEDKIKDDSFGQMQMEVSGSAGGSVEDYTVYDNGVVEFDLKVSITSMSDEDAARWKNSNYLSGGLRTGWALTVISLDSLNVTNPSSSWKDKSTLSSGIMEAYFADNFEANRIENAKSIYNGMAEYSFAVTRENDDEVKSEDKVSYNNDGSKFGVTNALANIAEDKFYEEYTNNISAGEITAKRQSLPVVYMVIPQSEIDLGTEDEISTQVFEKIIFDDVPKGTVEVKSNEYTNIIDIRFNKDDKDEPVKYLGSKYIRTSYIKSIKTRGITELDEYVLEPNNYGSVWKFLDLDKKTATDANVIFEESAGDMVNRTWFLYTIDTTR